MLNQDRRVFRKNGMPKFSKTSKKELLSITSDKISEQQHCQQRITEAGNFDSKPMDKEIQL